MDYKAPHFVRQFDGYDHYHFICWAQTRYGREKAVATSYARDLDRIAEQMFFWSWNKTPRESFRDLVRRLFIEGKHNYCLNLDFETFWERLDPVADHQRSHVARIRGGRWARYRSQTWYEQRGTHFRQVLNKGVTGKKNISEREQQRREWREASGINRDKRRNSLRGRKTWAKKISNRYHRAFERQLMAHECYDELPNKKPKDIYDTRMWS